MSRLITKVTARLIGGLIGGFAWVAGERLAEKCFKDVIVKEERA